MHVVGNKPTFTVAVMLTDKSFPEPHGTRYTFVVVTLQHKDHCGKKGSTLERD